MPYSLNFIQQDRFFEVVVSGDIQGYDELYAKAQEIVRRVRVENAMAVLLDECESRPFYDTRDVLVLADKLADEGLPTIGVKVATLFSPDNATISGVFETSMRNRSINYRIFRSREKAIAWLLS